MNTMKKTEEKVVTEISEMSEITELEIEKVSGGKFSWSISLVFSFKF